MEEVARMTYHTRYCTGCAQEQAFEQFHAEPGSCPDAPDGDCPEWGCSVCGDAFLIGLPVSHCAANGGASKAA
jgi:hypothetical protein